MLDFFCRLGGGNELLLYFFYHVVVSAKYHRAFMSGILVAFNYSFSAVLQLLYSAPIPVWQKEQTDSDG